MIGGKKLKFAEADNDSSSLVQRAIIDEPLVVVLVPKLRIIVVESLALSERV